MARPAGGKAASLGQVDHARSRPSLRSAWRAALAWWSRDPSESAGWSGQRSRALRWSAEVPSRGLALWCRMGFRGGGKKGEAWPRAGRSGCVRLWGREMPMRSRASIIRRPTWSRKFLISRRIPHKLKPSDRRRELTWAALGGSLWREPKGSASSRVDLGFSRRVSAPARLPSNHGEAGQGWKQGDQLIGCLGQWRRLG